jgi:hypothetical protein
MAILFCGSANASTQYLKALLMKYANGDWRVPGEVQHFCAPGCCPGGHAETLAVFVDEITPLIFKHCLPLWPRHRWVGVHEALDCIGLPLCLHNLLKECLPVWDLMTKKKHKAVVGDFKIDIDIADDCAGQLEDQAPRPADAADSVMAAVAPSKTASIDWAAFNEKCRVDSLTWVKSDPLPRVVIMRVAMDPHVALTAALLHRGCKEWDKQALISRAAGNPLRFRILECLESGAEEKYFELVADMFSSSAWWTVLQGMHLNEALAGMTFRMLSMGVCTLNVSRGFFGDLVRSPQPQFSDSWLECFCHDFQYSFR